MRAIRYFDFDLLIERTERAHEYEARVINAPSGEYAPIDFQAPFSDLELENFLLKIGRRRNVVRGLETAEASSVKEFGSRLFDSVFQGDVRLALATSLSETDSDDLGLRVRLRLNGCPELADLPWEYLYDKTSRRFLALSEWTPVVRYLDLPGRVRPLTVEGPLRILGMVSSPTDYPRLSVDDEWSKLTTALNGLVAMGRVELTRVPDGTLASLNRVLRRDDFHVFHYIGHGGFLPDGQDGVLVLEDAVGRGLQVNALDLGVSLHDHRTLRLAVLNSCEGARAGISDPYSGTAQTLVQQGIPAVVAMQFEITDESAVMFSHVLYEAIADGYPLDAAMAEARKAVRNQPNATEWGTPVLYLRAPDGRIFDMSQAQPTPPRHLEAAPLPEPVLDTEPVVAEPEQVADRPPTTEPAPAGGQPAAAPDDAQTARGPVATIPPGDEIGDGRQRRWMAIGAAALAVVVIAAIAIVAVGRGDGPSSSTTTSSPFESGLSSAAAPYFTDDECFVPGPDEAQFASSLPTTELINCTSGSAPYTATLWCTDTAGNFRETRSTVLGEAVDTPVKVTETPAGQDSVTDGVQRSYLHRGGETARVYWDSASALCGGVIQASDDNVDATVAFWHNGRS